MKKITVLALCLTIMLNGYGHDDANEVILRGKIICSRTHRPVDAKVDVFRNSDFTNANPEADAKGEFTMPLNDFGMYLISISAPGYLETTDTLWVLNERRKVITKNFYVAPIEVGLTVQLSNVYFQFGRAELSVQSYPELDKMINFFQANPGVHFEIAGHTDHSGPPEYNLKLSQDRAQAVVNYLTSHGVDPAQLVARGYGDTKPIGTGRTREAEARNRRVEFTVLQVGTRAGGK